MTHDRRLLAGALGLVLAVAACGGAASTGAPTGPAGTGAAPSTAPTEAPSAAPTDEPSPSDDNGGNGGNGGPGSASDLEATLPDEAGGVKFTKGSFDGAAIAGAGFISTDELDPILAANGKSFADVRMAIASPADTSGGASTIVLALQVRGLPADALLEMGGVGSGTDLETATIAGKQVQRGGIPGFMVYVYVKDDTLYEILFATEALGEAIIAQLP